jgi:CRP-like cAMP-binding protein
MVKNRLLRALVHDDYARLCPHLEPVPLEKGTVLIEPGQPITRVVFLESGLGSVIGITPGGEAAEVGLYGFDGMVGMPVVLGTDRSPHRLLMQIGGEGWQMPADALRGAMRESEDLSPLLARYVQFFLIMVAQTAVSNAVHTVEERLARWLLMAHDRMDGDDVPLTHEYLALMLAVRRPSVTTATQILEGAGVIKATRGNIRIRNRAALEDLAGAAYGVPETEYARLVGPMR